MLVSKLVCFQQDRCKIKVVIINCRIQIWRILGTGYSNLVSGQKSISAHS